MRDLKNLPAQMGKKLSDGTRDNIGNYGHSEHCCQVAEFWAAGLKNGPGKNT